MKLLVTGREDHRDKGELDIRDMPSHEQRSLKC